MYTIVDVEGNGGEFRDERITEIAIYKFDGRQIVDQFISLINPEADITQFVQKLTGITPKMVRTAPKFHEVAKRIVEITEGTTLIGHNIDFDYRMLRQSFKRLGYTYKINTLDTIQLAKKLIPEAESYSLGKLVKSLGIPVTDRHRASGDARATLELFKLLMSKDSNNEIIQHQFNETNAKTYLNKVKELTQDLPNKKGIIYFQNENGIILFSDYVDDIQKFAKKFFHSNAHRFKAIQEQTEQVNFELTGSNLLAKLIMKSKGIKKRENLTFGLFYINGKYVIDKNSAQPPSSAILKFSSFTQGLKALRHIKSIDAYKNPEELQLVLDLKKRTELWVLPGRILGEEAFVLIKNGKLEGFGFFEVHTQISTLAKVNRLKISMDSTSANLQNEMQMTLLKNEVKIYKYPT